MKTDCAFGVVKDRFFDNGIARKLARMKLFLFLAIVSALRLRLKRLMFCLAQVFTSTRIMNENRQMLKVFR